MITEKAIYKAWKKRIFYPKSSYEASAKKFVPSGQNLRTISEKSVVRKVVERPIIVFGDDALVMDQAEKMLAVISKLQGRQVFVTNRFSKKHQRDIDQFLRNRLSIETVLKKLNLPWLLEENSRNILSELKKWKIKVIAIGDGSESAIDQKFLKLASLVDEYNHVVFWTGHLRLSGKTFLRLQQTTNSMFLYLQSTELHWNWMDRTSWQSIDSSTYVWMNTSPITSLDLYGASQEYRDQIIRVANIESEVNSLIEKICSIVKEDPVATPPRILHIFNQTAIEKINRLKYRKVLFQFIKKRILAGESLTLPKDKSIVLATLRRSHVAEEAAHYIRLIGRKDFEFGKHSIVLEEALAFFASLLISPEREIPRSKRKMSGWDHVHAEGYALGFRLWKNWKRSKKMQSLIRELWRIRPRNDQEAQVVLKCLEVMLWKKKRNKSIYSRLPPFIF